MTYDFILQHYITLHKIISVQENETAVPRLSHNLQRCRVCLKILSGDKTMKYNGRGSQKDFKVSMGLWAAAVSRVFPFLATPGLQG